MLDHTPATGHFGDRITSIAVAVLPLVLRVDSGEFWDRLLLAICGSLGAGIAVLADKPLTWQETAGRIAAGFITCALFVPWLARRYGFDGQVDSLIAAAGVLGVTAWYVAGSSVRFLKWIRSSEIISVLLQQRFAPGEKMAPQNTPLSIYPPSMVAPLAGAQVVPPPKAPVETPPPTPLDKTGG